MSVSWGNCSQCGSKFRQSAMKIQEKQNSTDHLCHFCYDVTELQSLYDEYVDDSENYENQIRTLIEVARGARSTCVAKVVGCSQSYARRFRYDENSESALEKGWSRDSQEEKVSPGMRTRIIRRDGGVCLHCEKEDCLEVHHIIPVNEGGEKEDSNLATLCKSCHKKAHGGEYTTGGTIYETREGFNDWLGGTISKADKALDMSSTTQSTLSEYGL